MAICCPVKSVADRFKPTRSALNSARTSWLFACMFWRPKTEMIDYKFTWNFEVFHFWKRESFLRPYKERAIIEPVSCSRRSGMLSNLVRVFISDRTTYSKELSHSAYTHLRERRYRRVVIHFLQSVETACQLRTWQYAALKPPSDGDEHEVMQGYRKVRRHYPVYLEPDGFTVW